MNERQRVAGGSHVHKTPKEAQYAHGMSGPDTGHSWFFFYPSLGVGVAGKDNCKVRPLRGPGMQPA